MATTLEDLPDDVATRVFCQLDAPSLAAVSRAAAALRRLADQPHLWASLCTATWPSLLHPCLLPLLSKPFYFATCRFPSAATCPSSSPPPEELISAVDLFVNGELFFSTVIETNTTGEWFNGSPFRVTTYVPGLTSSSELELSWIVVDPHGGRGVNLSSRKPVAVRRRGHVSVTHVVFATVVDFSTVATMTVDFSTGEVCLCLEDWRGVCLSGRDSLAMIGGAMIGGRVDGGAAAAAYVEFLRRRVERKEKVADRERRLDLVCVVFSVVLSFLVFMFFQ